MGYRHTVRYIMADDIYSPLSTQADEQQSQSHLFVGSSSPTRHYLQSVCCATSTSGEHQRGEPDRRWLRLFCTAENSSTNTAPTLIRRRRRRRAGKRRQKQSDKWLKYRSQQPAVVNIAHGAEEAESCWTSMKNEVI